MTQVRLSNGSVARQFDNFFNDFFNLPSVWSNPSDIGSIPAANVTETPNAYLLELSVPGRNKEDFKINVEKGLLTVSFEKKEENTVEGTNSIRREFSVKSFKRSFSLDEKVDTANIQAKYENGILKIELPKKEHLKEEPKLISIS
jgi:HSP20 family protein